MRDRVVIVGAGPAGLAAAAACAEAGLPLTVIAPQPATPWRPTYGAWIDELSGLGLDEALAHRWGRPEVRFDDAEPIALERGYAVFDNARLQGLLTSRAARAGARTVVGAAAAVSHDAHGSVVRLAGGGDVPAGVVIDASGHRPALLRGGVGAAPAWQVAYGIIAQIEPALLAPGEMWLMDWRSGPLRDRGAPAVPTFAYAMDFGGGRTFVEETSLAARPAVRLEAVHRRLQARLDGLGVRVTGTPWVERVRFPMGGPLPPRSQRVVGFGAAAGMVHPATGFQVATALARAPALARALADVMTAPAATPRSAALAGWRAVWPPDLLRQRALHAYGLQVLLRLDGRGLQRFFAAFFDLPAPQWRAYLSGAASSRELARVMLAVVRRLPPDLAWTAVRQALGREGPALLRGLRGR